MFWSVTYVGDSRFPERDRPFKISGLGEFPLGKPVQFSDEEIRRRFPEREDPKAFLEFLFLEGGVYNANHKHPRFLLAEVNEDGSPIKTGDDSSASADDSSSDTGGSQDSETDSAPAAAKGRRRTA